MINLISNALTKLVVGNLLIACLLLFSEIYSMENELLIGGARADTNVNIGRLSKSSPSETDIVYTSNKALPKKWSQSTYMKKGQHAESIAREFFSSLEHENVRGSKFTTIACDGSYGTDNGYDGLYVVLDSDGAVARFNRENVVKSNSGGNPIIIINESKFSTCGDLVFGPGIKLSDETYAEQMSEAWVRIVAHNVLKRVKNGECEVCAEVNELLRNITDGRVRYLNVFRTATVLADDGTWNIYALGSDEDMVGWTKKLLSQLLGID